MSIFLSCLFNQKALLREWKASVSLEGRYARHITEKESNTEYIKGS